MLAKLTKNILRGVNFTNLKTLGGYIAKSKPQGICLQLSQTLRGDYVIWPIIICVVSVKDHGYKTIFPNM